MQAATQDTAISGDKDGASGSVPFAVHLSDFTMIDLARMRLFDAVGRARRPFAGVAAWPDLEELIHERSAALLAAEGKDAWAAAGGVLDDQGQPTFRASSTGPAGQVLQEVARELGGFVWSEPSGMRWAVCLVPLLGRPAGEYAGLAISCQGNEIMLTKQDTKGVLKAVKDHKVVVTATGDDEVRQRLAQITHGLWLYERAELLFWAIQVAVMMQRRSMVTLPDIVLGQIVWGPNRKKWPANWRGTLFRILRSLLTLRWAMLRLPRNGWRPRFGAEAVPIAYVEDRQVTAPTDDSCDGSCPLRNSGQRHGHFRLGTGPDFLGILEQFVVGKDGAERRYDFTQDPPGAAGEQIEAARKAGEIVLTHTPTKWLGPAAGLTAGQRGIVDALVRETTLTPQKRVKSKKGETKAATSKTHRPRDPRLVQKACVPEKSMRKWVVCPLLDSTRKYVTFGGNGKRPGMGYLVRTWAERAGYLKPGAEGPQQAATRAFLEDLHAVEKDYQLVVAGFRPNTRQWLPAGLLVELAALPGGAEELVQVHLRVYAPEDYLDRWRQHLAEEAGFSNDLNDTITTDSTSDVNSPLTGDARTDILIRMRRLGVTQQELAEHLKVRQPYVSKILGHGGHSIPPGRQEEIGKYLTAREASEGGWL